MTKEELSKLKKITAEVEQIKRELENVEPEYRLDHVKGSSANFPFTQHSIKIEGYDLESYKRKTKRVQNRLSRKLEELMDEKDMLTEYICKLDDSDLRQILMYRYINGMTWQEIGANMNYATSTIRRKHDLYIKKISTF